MILEYFNKKFMLIFFFGLCNIFLSYISLVYSLFSDGVGLPLHNITSSAVLVNSIAFL